MSGSRSQRRQQMKYFHYSAMVIGIFLAVLGLYMACVVSGETNEKNARCTESVQGIVSEVVPDGSKFKTTVDYTIEDFDKSVTFVSKKDLGVGNAIEVRYEPESWSHLYIEGVTSTGKNDIMFGMISVLVGAVFFTIGFIIKKNKDSNKEQA